jgi:predicted O-linked N-acetylglucosamine transferase (SPINDLY family)
MTTSVFEDARFKESVRLIQDKKLAEAKPILETLLRENPTVAEMWSNLGVVNHQLKLVDDAQACLSKALELKPAFSQARLILSDVYVDIGAVFAGKNDIMAAKKNFKIATQLNRRSHIAFYNLGVIYNICGKTAKSVQALELSFDISQTHIPTLLVLAIQYNALRRYDESIDLYKRIRMIDPTNHDAVINLATVMYESGNFNLVMKVLAHLPTDAKDCVYSNIVGMVERERGQYKKAIAEFGAHRTEHRAIMSNYLFLLNYDPHISLDSMFDEYRESGLTMVQAVQPTYESLKIAAHLDRLLKTMKVQMMSPGFIIKVGFVSGDIREHSVSYFIEPFFRNYDKTKFEIYVYATTALSDKRTDFMKRLIGGSDHFRTYGTVTNAVDERLCADIMKDGIHILVDLSGHTGNNSLNIFALKPAPIQVSYIGFPNTTGLPTMDYRIVDRILYPVDSKQKSVEKLIMLPGCFTCYTPPEATEKFKLVERPIAREEGVINIGTFTGTAKINEQMLCVCAAIMERMPNVRLILKSRVFTSKNETIMYLKRLAECGVNISKVTYYQHTATIEEHLQLYDNLDLTLDTFPYSGTTTTCESMYMGVPVVTMCGDRQSQNVSATILHTIGLDQNIARSTKEYVKIVVDLLSNPDKLRSISGDKLRSMMRGSLLCDQTAHCANLSKAFETMLAVKMN